MPTKKSNVLAPKTKEHLISTLSHFDNEEMSLIMAWVYGKSKNTQRYCRRILLDFFSHFPNTSLKSINVGHVTLFLNRFNHLKPGSRNLILATLSSLFKFLVMRKFLKENPCLGIKSERIPERWHSKILSHQDIGEMIKREPNIRNKLILRILYLTGIRRSELNRLQKKDFLVLEDGKIQMTVLGKGSKIRSLLINQSLWNSLKSYMNESRVVEDKDYLFPSVKTKASPLSDQQIYVIVKNAANRIGKPASAHWFRHSSATHAIEKGAPLHVVQRTLGHASLATTGKYLDARPNESNADYLKDPEIE